MRLEKTRPKINTPFKCYMYETKGRVIQTETWPSGRHLKYYDGRGKVIGEFVCYDIQTFKVFENRTVQYWNRYNLEQSCLTYDEVAKYIGINNNGYAWHISDLVIYGEPNEIYEFYSACKEDCKEIMKLSKIGVPDDIIQIAYNNTQKSREEAEQNLKECENNG